MKKKFELEMNKRNRNCGVPENELEMIYKKRYENLGSLQIDIRGLMERMSNRVNFEPHYQGGNVRMDRSFPTRGIWSQKLNRLFGVNPSQKV